MNVLESSYHARNERSIKYMSEIQSVLHAVLCTVLLLNVACDILCMQNICTGLVCSMHRMHAAEVVSVVWQSLASIMTGNEERRSGWIGKCHEPDLMSYCTHEHHGLHHTR